MSTTASKNDLPNRANMKLFLIFSFLFAELVCAIYFLPHIPSLNAQSVSRLILRAISFAAMAVTLVAVARSGSIRKYILRPSVLVASGIALAVRSLVRLFLAIASPELAIPTAFDCALRMLWGIGFAVQLCAAVRYASQLPRDTILKLLAMSFFFAGVTASFAVEIQVLNSSFVIALLAIFSALLLVSMKNEPEDKMLKTSTAGFNLVLDKKDCFIVVVDGVLTGIVACLGLQAFSSGSIEPLLAGGTLVCTAIAALGLYKANPLFLRRSRSQIILLPLIFLLILAMDLGVEPWNHYANLLLFSTLYVFNFANLFTLLSLSKDLDADPIAAFAWGRVPLITGEAVGWLAGAYLVQHAGGGLLLYTTIMLFALICVQLSLTVITRPEGVLLAQKNDADKSTDEPASTEGSDSHDPSTWDGGLAQRCHVIAETYNLTRRERDVLDLLARGRSMRYIADELVVSEATVRTHVNHIYRKLGTHSRQELIDIIEGESIAR